MLNVAITATCNRSCDYCFALEVLDNRPQTEMSTDMFDKTLELAARSGLSEIRLLGGEPTIHRNFADFVDRALSRKLRVIVLTGGLIPQKTLDYLAETPAHMVSLLMNVVAPWEHEPAMQRKQIRVMRQLGPRIALGLNIANRGFELYFLLRLIDKYRLERTVRLGVAHPIRGGGNAWLRPKHYHVVGERVASFARDARAADVSISFDCGWVPCMFPDGALDELGYGPQEIGLRCSPILDVLVDGSVISCYPLADHARLSIDERTTTHDMRDEFSERQRRDRAATLFPHCPSCRFFNAGQCTSGCLSASMRRIRSIDQAAQNPMQADT